MTSNNHLNQMFFQANDPDFNYDQQDVNDQEISYTLPRLRPENWQNLNDYDESQFISVCSHESNLEKNQMQDEYLEKLEKGIDQYCQTKKHNEKPLTKLQQHTVFSENQIDQSKQQNCVKKKRIIKSPKGTKLTRRTTNNIKIEQELEKNKKRTRINQEVKKDRKGMKVENKNNLKNISKKVCQYMQSFEFISNSQLFNKLKQQMQKNRNKSKQQEDQQLKNLKRRMYDVVNVLRSSDIIFPQNQNKRKFIFHRNTQFQLDQLKSELRAQQVRLKQKKQICQMLKRKQQSLKLLRERNAKLQQQKQIQQSQKVHFPFYFYNHMSNEQCEVNSRQVRIKNIISKKIKQGKKQDKKQGKKQDKKQDKKQENKKDKKRVKRKGKNEPGYTILSQVDTLKYLFEKDRKSTQTKPFSPMQIEIHKKEIPGLKWTQFSNIQKIRREQSKYA